MTAIEVDKHLAPVLRSVVEPEGATVVEARRHAARLGGAARAADPARPWSMVANLPYNIATPLVLDLLEGVPTIERMVVLVQLEVGERLAAGPGTKTYGIPSVKRAWWADAAVVAKVPASVFIPQPRVESAVVDLRRHEPAGAEAERAVVFDLDRDRASTSAARCCAARSPTRRRPTTSRPPTSAPKPGPRSSPCADWQRLAAVLA